MQPDTFLTRKQVAVKAGVHVRTVDGWRKRGLLTTYRDNRGRPCLSAQEVGAFLIKPPEPEVQA